MNIDAFDFDGTLIRGDSIKIFSKWVCNSRIEFIFRYYFLNLRYYNNLKKLKLKRVKTFYSLMSKRNKNIYDYYECLNKQLFKDSISLLNKSGNIKVIVSASYQELIGGYCKKVLGVKLVCNSFSAPNLDVNYKQKVISLTAAYGHEISIVNAYGNSKGDYDLLQAANNSFYRDDKGKLILWSKN